VSTLPAATPDSAASKATKSFFRVDRFGHASKDVVNHQALLLAVADQREW